MKKTGIAILLAALLFGQTAAAAVYEGAGAGDRDTDRSV